MIILSRGLELKFLSYSCPKLLEVSLPSPALGSARPKPPCYAGHLRLGGLKPHYHCLGTWKQQDMVTKSTQTQYGGKYDGRSVHSKKQKGYTTETPITRNTVTMLIFPIKRFNKSQKRYDYVVPFLKRLKI